MRARARGATDEPGGVRGVGVLLERDYWAVLQGCPLSPRDVAGLVAERFEELPPAELARFRREGPSDRSLEVGDGLEVRIRGYGDAFVRVVHKDENSLTIATLPRHPEAGRITFGAYRNARGDVVFHIRSRARSSDRFARAGFLLGGEGMQTNCWTDFIDRLGATVGEGCRGAIFTETHVADEEPEDRPPLDRPTFLARGS